MIKIKSYSYKSREHKIIKKILLNALKPYEKSLADFKIYLYDTEADEKTGLLHNKKQIDFNLRQLLRLYKNPDQLNRVNKDHLKRIKSFKKYLIFVLFHELGHFKQKRFFNNIYGGRYGRQIAELRADYFALRVLKRLKVIK